MDAVTDEDAPDRFGWDASTRLSMPAQRPHMPPTGCQMGSLRHRQNLPLGMSVADARSDSWTGIMEVMSKSSSRRFPVTVTHLPVTRCQICRRTVAYRPGSLSDVLTEHYRRAHPEALGLPSQ